MQDLLGAGDSKKVRAVAGLAGGVGHRGAACGALVGGALALSLASAEAEDEQAVITARACGYVSEFVRRFKNEAGSTLCADITRTDFDDNAQLRRYILTRSLTCVRLASKAASHMVEIIASNRPPEEPYRELNRRFSEHNFHCAYSVFMLASEGLGVSPALSGNMLIPLNGGIAYAGSTCTALVGGCILIGLQRGGDTSQTGTFKNLRRLILTLIQGSAAFNRLDLSPANDALMRCSQLSRWFEDKYGSHLCSDLAKTDFRDAVQARRFFDETISRCTSMAEQTATKAAELAR